jgi:hypothetical protein
MRHFRRRLLACEQFSNSTAGRLLVAEFTG